MATADNGNYSNQHNMIQQQPNMDNDEATTNCSETMSTANEDEECFGPIQATSMQLPEPTTSGQPHNERPASSCRPPASSGQGDIQQSDSYGGGRASEEPLTECLAMSPGQETDGCQSSARSELSLLASGATQAPPSYGTATRVCATLDAGQLRDIMGPAQAQQQDSVGPFRFRSSASQHGGLARAANQFAYASSVQMQPPLFGGPMAATIGHRHQDPASLSATRTQQQQQAPQQSFRQLTRSSTVLGSHPAHQQQSMGGVGQHLGQYPLSISGGSLNRANFMGPHLNGAASNGQCQQRTNPRLDNNQEAACELNGVQKLPPQQQQVTTNFELALPINHVISANGSIQWQPQTNQSYLAAAASATKTKATNYGISMGQQQQQSQQAVAQLDGARSSLKSARIMDAPFAWPPTAVPMAASFRGDQQRQLALAANRNGPQISWPHEPSPTSQASISGGASSLRPNVNHAASQRASALYAPVSNQENLAAAQGWQQAPNQRPSTLSLNSRQQQQRQHNNNDSGGGNNPAQVCGQLMQSKVAPSRRSDENLERRHQQQQAATTNRKRRRHRSTSGRSVSPESRQQVRCARDGNEAGAANTLAQDRLAWPPPPPQASPANGRGLSDGVRSGNAAEGGPNHKRTISAHCWLIDSSDDQTYGSSGRRQQQQRQPASLLAGNCASSLSEGTGSSAKVPLHLPPQQTAHLTVAMMKQTLEHHQRLKSHPQPGPSEPTTFNHQNRQPYPSLSMGKYMTQPASHNGNQPHSSHCETGTATKTNQEDKSLDLTVSLRTNSLRMERILNRSPNSGHRDDPTGGAGSRTMPAARRHERHHRRRYISASSSSSSSSPSASQSASSLGQCSATSGPNKRQAGSAPRLSTLLTLLASLVRRGGARKSHTSRSVAPSASRNGQQPEIDEYYPAAPANSISGSVLAARGGPPSSLGPYTAGGSLAISSSSSTSAYATESSHPSSSANSNPLRLLAHLSTTGGSSAFPADKLTGGAGLPMAQLARSQQAQVPPSSASTAGSSLFYSSSGNSGLQISTAGSHSYEYCDDDRINETRFVKEKEEQRSGLEASSQTSSSGSNEKIHADDLMAATSSSGGGRRQREAGLHNAANLMSDNELLSAGSEAGFQGAALAAVVSQATSASAARRRWWWNSLKDVLCRRPCGRTAGSGSAADSEEGAPVEPVQRYKSLRSRRGRTASTLENVLSLAKADKVFRARLLASLLVSCILLGLIGLLCGLIYSRSSAAYKRSRLGLLIDDSDYDLSWLWPLDSGPLQEASVAPGGDARGFRMLELQFAAARSPTKQLMMDGSLRGPLILIEQSEQLAQYQQTMAHLTNLQLANDRFVDLTQMANRLRLREEDPNEMAPNQTTAPPKQARSRKHLGRQVDGTSEHRSQLSNSDQELISLTLLSNLHWPLVKWRHQNQQSVANFLSSFAAPTGPNGASATQTHLRGLLSVLLLAEARSELPAATNNNSQLTQFGRLNFLLKSSSYHIVSCANQLDDLEQHPASPPEQRLPLLRRRFCEQLVSRYRRMMLVLGQLNHSNLVKLRDPMEPAQQTLVNAVSGGGLGGADGTGQQLPPAISSRTLLSFFLDRLALLDVEILAESTLAAANLEESSELELGAGWDDEEHDELNASYGQLEGRALAKILRPSLDLFAMEPSPGGATARAQTTLLELAKSIVSDGPTTRLDPDSELGEWAAHLKHLETDNNEAWRELLARDLLYPWASSKLPRSVQPLTYDLFLHPNLTTRLVLGMVKIGFRLERPTRFIVLHCDKLNLADVSLWLKQDNNTRSSSGGLGNSEILQRLPVRRILSNSKLEQIYIELQHQLNPAKMRGQPTRQSSFQQPTFNFGSELPQQQQQEAAYGGESLFILSASFNKTSLMQRPYAQTSSTDAENIAAEHGLEFVQYTDYFAQSEAELKTLLYTQFEPQNARRLFPSFDEPRFKAKFQLNLVHDVGHQVLFNAPKRERVPYSADGARQMSVFEATPIPLSTYLVAFVVCDAQNMKSITSRASQLQSTSADPVGGSATTKAEQRHIQVQILAQFEQLGQAEFASQLVPQLLAFYQNHLHFPYPMDKLDLVAIPRATAPSISSQSKIFGQPLGLLEPGLEQQQKKQQQSMSSISQLQRLNTMENMGLIWFKANILLVDTNLISQNLIEQVAMIISHQLAHQYFGNIVTISQWDDLWLYESLCQYLESMALSQVQPDWRLDEQFVVTSIQDTLAVEQFDWPQFPAVPRGELQLKTIKDTGLIRANHPPGESFESTDELDGAEFMAEMGALPGNSNDGQQELGADTGGQQSISPVSSNFRVRDANELRRSSAILHMLLFNLLPTPEARARLLGGCLSSFRYGTMSKAQFWRQFGEQLAREGSSERLALVLELEPGMKRTLTTSMEQADGMSQDQLSIHAEKWRNFTATELQSAGDGPAIAGLPSERVVFVRPSSSSTSHRAQVAAPGETTSGRADVHRLHVRSPSGSLGLGLDLAVEAWLERRGYPLITASFNRDRIQLRQERFSFAWWNEPGLLDDEPAEVALNDDVDGGREVGEGNRTKRMASGSDQPPLTEVGGPTWSIPLMFVSRINQKQARFFWMNKREMELPLQELSYSSMSQDTRLGFGLQATAPSGLEQPRKGHLSVWFKLNVNQSSLVRVNYDERNWEALTELLLKSHYSNHLLGPLDRANLIDDAITLMRCGKLSVGVAMNLTLYLEVGEREFMPWTSALRHLDQMQTLLNQNPLWHRYVLKLMQPISSVIGWKDDGPHLMRKLRRSLFSVALQYGDERTISKAKQEFKGWLKNGRFIVPNLQELVYVAGVRYGDQQEWFHCWQKYQQLVALDLGSSQQNQTESSARDNIGAVGGNRDDRQSSSPLLANVAAPFGSMVEQNEPNAENEKRQLITALASTHNTWLLEQFLNYSLDSTKIQHHHLKHVMQTLGKNPVARLYLWRFVRLNWNSLMDRYTGSNAIESPNIARYSSSDSFRGSRDAESYQILETMIVESTKHFVTKLDYDEVKTFFETKRKHKQRTDSASWSPSLEQAIQKSLQVIRSNIYWRNYIEPKLTKWLSHYDSSMIN